MKTKNVYIVMCKDMNEVESVIVFDDKDNAKYYIEQLEEENEGCGFEYYIEDSKAILVNEI